MGHFTKHKTECVQRKDLETSEEQMNYYFFEPHESQGLRCRINLHPPGPEPTAPASPPRGPTLTLAEGADFPKEPLAPPGPKPPPTEIDGPSKSQIDWQPLQNVPLPERPPWTAR